MTILIFNFQKQVRQLIRTYLNLQMELDHQHQNHRHHYHQFNTNPPFLTTMHPLLLMKMSWEEITDVSSEENVLGFQIYFILHRYLRPLNDWQLYPLDI